MTRSRAGGSGRKKRNDYENSQFSVISNYQLRPRNEHSRVSQLTSSQVKAYREAKSPYKKKIVEKYNRKNA